MQAGGAVTQYRRPFVQDRLGLCNTIWFFFTAQFTTELVFSVFNVLFFSPCGPKGFGPTAGHQRGQDTSGKQKNKKQPVTQTPTHKRSCTLYTSACLYCERKRPVTQSRPPQVSHRCFITDVRSLNGVLRKYCKNQKKEAKRIKKRKKKTASDAEDIPYPVHTH